MNKNEIRELSMEEKEQVTGGTVEEVEELAQAVMDSDLTRGIAGAGSHIPGCNAAMANSIESFLDKQGINADLSVGFLGTGIGSSANKYTIKETGKPISHQDVVNYVKNL